tara:strand:- start:274 stop:426 length:153 start_codon:yes stop_codon:yes gene_type:complete
MEMDLLGMYAQLLVKNISNKVSNFKQEKYLQTMEDNLDDEFEDLIIGYIH